MSDTDTLTQATRAVKASMGLGGLLSDNEAQKYARAALEAAGALPGTAQPNPAPNREQGCHDRAIEMLHTYWSPTPEVNRLVQDLIVRREFGLKKYGQPLQPFNGRNAAADAYEEVQDLLVYLVQMNAEGTNAALVEQVLNKMIDSTFEIALTLATVQE